MYLALNPSPLSLPGQLLAIECINFSQDALQSCVKKLAPSVFSVHYPGMFHEIQNEVERTGNNIFQAMENDSQSIFNKDWWYGRIMEWSMKNQDFKVRMFRFVDVLPYLNSSSDVARHLKEYFSNEKGEMPKVFGMGLGLGSLAPGILAGAVKKNVTQMAKMFIAGETPQDALPVLKKARKNNKAFTVDLLGEVTVSEKESEDYQRRYIELVEWLAKAAQSWESNELLDQDNWGKIPSVNVSVKLSSLYSQINIKDWDNTVHTLKEKLRPILQTAINNNVFINIDMEHYDIKDLTLETFRQIIFEDEFKDYPHLGIVIQAYLRDSYADVATLVDLAKKRKVPFTIRLVKGAYWDQEKIHAEQRGWPYPVYTEKQESDANYERCAQLLIENNKYLKVAIASHNVRTLAACMVMAQKYNLPQNGLELQMLHGMADPIKSAVLKMGYRLREYTPVGELIPGMAYLVRRLLENTSNESFLKSKFADNVSIEELLQSPHDQLPQTSEMPRLLGFINEPYLDFNESKERTLFNKALERQSKQFASLCPLVINGKEIKTANTLKRENPSHPNQVVTELCLASKENAEYAIQAAKKAFQSWKHTPAQQRSQIIHKLADLILESRYDLAALEVYEIGKPWSEADADITEAIDFCRYYADEMLRLDHPQRIGHIPGETSYYVYQPRGVCVAIAPWNFPLAILCGMTTAALVSGNTVIMKPAEQSTQVAYRFMQLALKAGVPQDVLHFLPGVGEDVGAYLVAHKDTSMIAFTGSKAVGLQILEKSAARQPGQLNIKKCVIEMGGKNALIVDSDADLDEAVHGALYSAFGFQGQKCSACSRLIVLEENYDRFIERFVEATKSIHVGFAEDPQIYLGPVVDKTAQEKALQVIEEGKKIAKLLYQAPCPKEGYFVPPTIFADVDPNSFLAQQEFFAPIVAIIKAQNIDEAIRIANSTEYALTGGVYSRSPANIEKVKRELEVGNLYINRSITGAMVNRHPFGGFKMSGTGTKAGGPDYLLQFLEPKCLTENTLRRGFAPEEDSAN